MLGRNEFGQCFEPDGVLTHVACGGNHSLYVVLIDCDADGISDTTEIANGTAIDLNGNGIDDECDPDCDQNDVPDFYQIEQGAFDCNLNGILDICEISEEPELDLNTNTVIDSCESDCNENGSFDFVDLFLGISQDINKNSVPDECEDCDGDGIPDDLEDKADCDETDFQMFVKPTTTATTMVTSMLATPMMMETALKIYAMQTHAA